MHITSFYFVVEFFVPLLYMFFAYAKIAVSLWKRSKNETIHKAVAKAKMKSTRLMVAAFVVLVFCRPPILVLQLLEVYRVFDNRSFKNTFLISIWCAMAQISSSSLSPVIYTFLSPEFRTSVLKHCCFFCSRRVSIRGHQHCPLGRVEPVTWHRRITAENHQNIKFSAYVPSACLFLESLRRGLSTGSD